MTDFPRYILWVGARQFYLCSTLVEAADWHTIAGGTIYEPLGMTTAEKVHAEPLPEERKPVDSMLADAERDTDSTVDERDAAHNMLDKFVEAVGGVDVCGEYVTAVGGGDSNYPWVNALEAVRETFAERDALRVRIIDLETALKPFALIADDCPELPDGMAVRPTGFKPTQAEMEPTMATCRAASLLLKTKT